MANTSKLAPDSFRAVRVDVDANGLVRLPKHILEAAGTGSGKFLLVRFDDDEIKLVTPEATTQKIRASIRKHVSDGVSFVEDLLADRRREFEREIHDAKG